MKPSLPQEKFFLTSALNVEEFLLQEMKEVFPFFIEKNSQPVAIDFPECELKKGGVEFRADLFIAHQFQIFTKTSHRLLWRIDEFKARDFPTLYNKIKSSRLKNLLASFPDINIKCSASESRLGQEKRIESSALEALEKKANSEAAITVFIRVHQDLVQLSLDLSGEHLHFRNYATGKGAAPLRETWASLFFSVMSQKSSLSELMNISLLDPFVGSGTLLFESSLLFQPNISRSYSLNHLSQAPKIIKSADFFKNYKTDFPMLLKKMYAIEKDSDVYQITLKNVENVKRIYPKLPEVKVQKGDCFQLSRADLGLRAEESLWIFTNPPYGDRLPSQFNLRKKSGVEALVQELVKRYQPQKLGLVLPFDGAGALKKEAAGFVEFNHGGLHCAFISLNF